MGRLTENSVIITKNKSHSVTAQVMVPNGGAEGVIIAQGGAFGGWSLYAKDGNPCYCYNFAGLKQFTIRGEKQIPVGEHQVRMEFTYDGGGLGKGGTAALFIDGKKVGEGRVDVTVPLCFSADETCDVGRGTGTPVSSDYGVHGNEFTGKVHWVKIDLGLDSQDHMVSPEERFRVAMARQ
jgi:arylsulfatase